MSDQERRGGAFYRCDKAGCGLRFPVATNDPFAGKCPRCGSPVRMVALVEAGASHQAETPSFYPFASNLHLLLDNWRSLFNVGAAFRTADGAGVRHLYLCGITATPDAQQRLAKTALGAEKAVAWSYHTDAVQLAAKLQGEGSQLWVLERGKSSESLFDINELPRWTPVVVAAGNEVIGGDPELAAMADRVIHLPMLGNKESLNVAVALSIAAYWLRAKEIALIGDERMRALREVGKH